ncbi:MAG: hypothetical protein H0X36_03390 [Sphingomonadaceae bacterium]|nr:hypothetical protein [Sphingomonadaceae bacterium]
MTAPATVDEPNITLDRRAPSRHDSTISYGAGMAGSRLRIPVGKAGTARNMNTVAKLAEMAAALI